MITKYDFQFFNPEAARSFRDTLLRDSRTKSTWLREEEFKNHTPKEIAQEMFRLADGCTFSAKKDGLANIGGFLALNDGELAQSAKNLVVIYEGLHTYGGMAGRDMEAMAIGIAESLSDDHMRARVGQVQYLGQKLIDAGIPIAVVRRLLAR